MKKWFCCLNMLLLCLNAPAQPLLRHHLHFGRLAAQWDEAIPLGNGIIGALVWQKGDRLRFSLDRADLWDARPMKSLHRKEFSYQWVYEQVKKKEYAIVQQYFDAPYDREAAPGKIPGGALEFNSNGWGQVQSVHLFLQTAMCEVKWSGGITLKTFVAANQPAGWFRFEHLPAAFSPQLIAPQYQRDKDTAGKPEHGNDVSALHYPAGRIVTGSNSSTYRQRGWNGFEYEISVRWKKAGNAIEGAWSISAHYPRKTTPAASSVVAAAMQGSYQKAFTAHAAWWKMYWNSSSLQVPDTLLEKQWYLEQYKFGSAARAGAPPISLQAVWTADNGRLPPWKGDYHHDLNTELSYWPAYSGNHLTEAMAYLDHLDGNKANYRRYTKLYFGDDGLAVPGVTTLDGTEMGGWIQYALSPTVSAWLAHHYYLQWRYGMDKTFLRNRAYPWIRAVAKHLESITIKDGQGFRKLPISSSPEINNNALGAWFLETTNYDLALMKFVFHAAAELAGTLHLEQEALHWKEVEATCKDFAVSPGNAFMVAPGLPYRESHRHFSFLMAFHPLALVKWEDGQQAQTLIKNSIHLLDSLGAGNWNGYSYAWLANIKARAKDGEGAANALRIFAKAFCSVNSFHVNGDQSASGLSKRTYRPFTLEGNFAFAAGLQEMLLQSYAGFIDIMPAVPQAWQDVSFNTLRAEGAFLVSAARHSGQMEKVRITAEKGGKAILKLPFTNWYVAGSKQAVLSAQTNGFVTIFFKKGGTIWLKNKSLAKATR